MPWLLAFSIAGNRPSWVAVVSVFGCFPVREFALLDTLKHSQPTKHVEGSVDRHGIHTKQGSSGTIAEEEGVSDNRQLPTKRCQLACKIWEIFSFRRWGFGLCLLPHGLKCSFIQRLLCTVALQKEFDEVNGARL